MYRRLMLTELEVLTPEVERLLARAVGPDTGRVRLRLEEYRTDSNRRLFAWVEGGRPVSAAGVREHGKEVEILHLGTAPGQERRGHARALLHAVATHLGAARMVAETGDDAVGFYRRADFEVMPAPPRGGPRRYRAVLTRP